MSHLRVHLPGTKLEEFYQWKSNNDSTRTAHFQTQEKIQQTIRKQKQ
jgi:hypothetical protein